MGKEENNNEDKQQQRTEKDLLPDDGNSSEVSSEESDDDSNDGGELPLDGVAKHNSDYDESSSSDDDDDDDDNDESNNNDDDDGKQNGKDNVVVAASSSKKRKSEDDDKDNKTLKKNKKKRKSNNDNNNNILQVEFTFCDMDEKYYHNIKSLLHNSSTVYQGEHASIITDLIIQNVAIGTVVSTTEIDRNEGNCYAFASILNITTYQSSLSIQYLKNLCINNCPIERKNELEVILSGTTNRPAGFLLHGRMINMPLNIVHVLHEQLILDIDWAIQNAYGTEQDRKALDYGILIRIAPCQIDKSNSSSIVYKFFDDEIFANNSEFIYTTDTIPKSYSKEDKQYVSIIIMTKNGHRNAVKEMKQFIS